MWSPQRSTSRRSTFPITNWITRGIGEIGITGTGAAICNAIFHATGKRIRDLPITPDKLL
jgi:xanthine dehydrogenase YagR molybdenum-binding subunit